MKVNELYDKMNDLLPCEFCYLAGKLLHKKAKNYKVDAIRNRLVKILEDEKYEAGFTKESFSDHRQRAS
uniref:Uncharacterized protein n=1 Tax=viral metagenome TaxID=1070528 RepID=A0A6M3IYR1_9ZZZZ